MNLLGLGPGELLLIAMLGLIVFGPGRLPEIAAQAGKMVRDLRRSTSDMTREFQEAMAPLNELREFQNELPRAIGSAAVLAQNGVTTPAESAATTGAAAAPEPAVADTTEWHWEGAPSAEPVAAAMEESPATPSFWDWDAPEHPRPARRDGNGTVPTRPASIWEWEPEAARAGEPA
jgi:Tat protein translocase TatB subunit